MAPQDAFPDFFRRVMCLKDGHQLKQHERTAYLVFIINVFQVRHPGGLADKHLALAGLKDCFIHI